MAETGVAVPAVSAQQMRELDRFAVEETGPSLLQMMENAGRTTAHLAIELLGEHWKNASVLVLAGGGGNGGGGICSARHLSNRGVSVNLCLANPDKLSTSAAKQRKIFRSTSGKEIRSTDIRHLTPDFIIDALIGYGLDAAPRGATKHLIAWANVHREIPILSLDVPSGIDATTGRALGECIRPRWTVTLALPKSGLRPQNAGHLFLADLGIPLFTLRRVAPDYVSPYQQQFWIGLKYPGQD